MSRTSPLAIKTPVKGRAPSLALKKRHKTTRKWPNPALAGTAGYPKGLGV